MIIGRWADGDWFWVIVSLLIRLPLFLLPAPGRDEATYHAWALTDHGAYAPLMLSVVRVLDTFLPPLAAIRGAAAFAGVALVWVLARHLRATGAPPAWRQAVMVAVIGSPWFVYSSGTLHPDPFLTVCMVAAATSWAMSRPFPAAAWAVAAALSKPSGVATALTVALFLAIDATSARRSSGAWHRPLAAAIIAAAGGAMSIAILGPDRVHALGALGIIDRDLPFGARFGVVTASFVLLAGPLLPIMAIASLRGSNMSADRVGIRARRIGFGLAAVALVAFLLAGVARGQVKPNWWIPSLVVLAVTPGWVPRVGRVRWALGGVGVALSLGLGLAFASPSSMDAFERFLNMESTYAVGAGRREAGVSATTRWSERVREYHPSPAAAAVVAWWGTSPKPTRLITDDYGLAAQLAFAIAPGRIELDVPDDLIHPRPFTAQSSVNALWLWRHPQWATTHDVPPTRRRIGFGEGRDSAWVARTVEP